MKKLAAAIVTIAGLTGAAMAENRIDTVRPDAPELAGYGQHPVGVRSLQLTDEDRVDVLNSTEAVVRGARSFAAELWYPAADGTSAGTAYQTVLRDGQTAVELTGRAARDAEPAAGPFPLVLISHGYPGNRYLLSHLAETLASRGHAVLALDHTDSTYSDQAAFGSTLFNRPLDQAFAIEAMADAGALDPVLEGLIDADRAAVVGYSMGGYGALIFGGAGVSASALDLPFAPPQDLLSQHRAGSDTHEDLMDSRVKAVVAIGPWGMNTAFWDAEGLSGLRVPTLIMAGDRDTVSGYGPMRAIFEGARGTERHLLTFINAGHNAAAPIPAPAESWPVSESLGWAPFAHYADPVWDTARMNNIAQHFVAAFLDLHLSGNEAAAEWLDLVEYAHDGVWSEDEGTRTPEHTYWEGFDRGTALGLRFESRTQGE
ncbi:alpha/beta fold hydrolase [Pararhodobacter sp. SW119]|uniref:alpha/beta hydrolase family protein n=1 Tax=Pararhodobacter sp. SW119 TaxID=2780075 RepID=UPI001AE0C66F|nr:alpha/beta fold hydrolase [Pararhodobacter sp. SW119]